MKRLFVSLMAITGLAACGGGTLALQLTDAPPDTENMASVVVSLARVEAHVVDKSDKKDGDPSDSSIDKDDKWVTIPMEGEKQFDLLALQNDAVAALGDLQIPEGKVTQIRLFLDPQAKNEITMKDQTVCPLDMSDVPTNGIKINHPFKAMDVDDGKKLTVTVDFDVKESVTLEGTCNYKLKPVIKIKTTKVDDE